MSRQQNVGNAAAAAAGGGACNLDVNHVSELFGAARNMRQYWLDTFPTDFTIIFKPDHDDDNNTTKTAPAAPAAAARKVCKFDVHTHVLIKFEVFKTMLESETFKEGRDKQLAMRAGKSVVVEKFIEFLYEDDLSDNDKRLDNDSAAVQELLMLAHKYMMQPLKELFGTKLERVSLVPLAGSYEHIQNRALNLVYVDAFDWSTVQKGLEILQLAITYDVKTLKLAAQSKFASWAPIISTDKLKYWMCTADNLTQVVEACARELACRVSYSSKEKVFELWLLAYDMSNKTLFDAASKHFVRTWPDVQLSSSSAALASPADRWRVFRALAKRFVTRQQSLAQVVVVPGGGGAIAAAKK